MSTETVNIIAIRLQKDLHKSPWTPLEVGVRCAQLSWLSLNNIQGIYINQGSNHSESLYLYLKNGYVTGPNDHSEYESSFYNFM